MPISSVILLFFLSFGFNDANDHFGPSPPNILILNGTNYRQAFSDHKFLIVTFYSKICRYSAHFLPQFYSASKTYFARNKPSPVSWATVDCTAELAICREYQVFKTPTVQLFVTGILKNEYRSARSPDDLIKFIDEQLRIPLMFSSSLEALRKEIAERERNIVFQLPNSTFSKIEHIMVLNNDHCHYWWIHTAEKERQNISYYGPDKTETLFSYVPNESLLFKAISNVCTPPVKEFTFANAEFYAEQNIPLLLYFRNPMQPSIYDVLYEERVRQEVNASVDNVVPLATDGFVQRFVLHKLGKNISNLPVLLIDSFIHIYDFGDISKLKGKGALRAFLDSLYNGRLHKDQYGSDHSIRNKALDNAFKNLTEGPASESVYEKLKPSESRYTFLPRDEL